MVQYWIATSNWYRERVVGRPCSSAEQRNDRHIWWFDNVRDINIQVGDMVLVYQGGDNVEARKEGIIIDNQIKCCFIGNFTINRLDVGGCPGDNTDSHWHETLERNFLWPPERIFKRKSIDDSLLVRAAGRPELKPRYVGLIFKDKTWIRLEERAGREYYERVMQRRNHN
ncbi:Uncharacterised protein [uncultured archaeon]|nr:Uncharacterised protein [uncultured archaeon]